MYCIDADGIPDPRKFFPQIFFENSNQGAAQVGCKPTTHCVRGGRSTS